MANTRNIERVAVIGSGIMGMGIAALAASAGCPVVLLDMTRELADKAVERMQAGRSPALDDPQKLKLITTGSLATALALVADCDWICEAVVENIAIKHALFSRLETARRDGSIITTNTSGIPLRDIDAGLPVRLRRDIAVTHFFNPVKVMRLLELVPGEATDPAVIEALAAFARNRLGKGVVYAKDTVNFIGNRIGCFWILAGLHKARGARHAGLDIETIDALLSAPIGLPSTGLYGLVDLIGLDVMSLVANNLAANLPANDVGQRYATLPPAEQAMLKRGQLGRKAGGGIYRLNKQADGSKLKEVYDLEQGAWRTAREVRLTPPHDAFRDLMAGVDIQSRLVWDITSATLCYAADLIPEIADDVVNIDRAMRWGFNWAKGPFELIDTFGAAEFGARLEAESRPMPRLLTRLRDAGATSFYRADGGEFFGLDGKFHPTPVE